MILTRLPVTPVLFLFRFFLGGGGVGAGVSTTPFKPLHRLSENFVSI